MRNDKEEYKKEFIRRLIRLSVKTIEFSEVLKSRRILWSIIDQLIRAITSIGANVVEAKSSSSRRDYIKFFEISLKSANEAKYWLMLVIETQKDDGIEKTAKVLLEETDEVSKIIGSSVLTLKGKNKF